jgi:hypothetical protein
MRQDEIKTGRIYSNGKGRERKVLARVSCPSGWLEGYCIRYQVVQGPRSGQVFTITLRKFATWAWKEVDED